jgi:hypothetical protein
MKNIFFLTTLKIFYIEISIVYKISNKIKINNNIRYKKYNK